MAQATGIHQNLSVFMNDFSEISIIDAYCKMARALQDLQFVRLCLAADVQRLILRSHIDVLDNFYL